MTDEQCAYCDAPATEPDHLTGRPFAAAPYFDPDLWVPSCRSCNLVNERGWSVLALLDTGDLLPTRYRRLAFGTGRLYDVEFRGPVHREFWGALRDLALDVVREQQKCH
jgi:hypothetical protein